MDEISPFARGGVLRPQEIASLAGAFTREMAARGRTGQLVVWESTYARAYVYAGQWVADCPQSCGNVELLFAGNDRKDVFICSYCKCLATSIHWPIDPDPKREQDYPMTEQIMDVLNRRPIPHTRNWYPEGHMTAIKLGIPDGETIEELIAENHEHGID